MASYWDEITGRAAKRREAELREAIADLSGRANRQAALLAHTRAQLRETTTTDMAAKLAATGSWSTLGGVSPEAEDIVNGRLAYLDRWTDRAGRKRRFGYARRAVDLHADFCFGGGLEAPLAGDKRLDKFLADWWQYPRNQSGAFSMLAQKRLSAKMLVDGCILLACHGVGLPLMQVRPMERLQFREVIVHPDDESQVLYYQRRWRPATFENGKYETDGQERVLYYADADNDEDTKDPYRDQFLEAKQLALDEYGNPVRIVRACLRSLSPRDWGVPTMPDLMDWELMMIEAAEDQATMSRASAALAIMLSVDGDDTDIAAAEAYYGQGTGGPDTGASNPGDINILNSAAKLTVSRAGTGSDETARNTRTFLQAMAVVAGWAPHYLGDSENANLATTKSMELPILRYCMDYQGLWVMTLTVLAKLALQGARNAEDVNITIPMPQLLSEDLISRVEAIQIGAAENWASDEQSTREYWTAMGAADVASEVETAMKAAKEAEKEQEAMRPPVPWPPEGQEQSQQPGVGQRAQAPV
jgi:hypothetical protein